MSSWMDQFDDEVSTALGDRPRKQAEARPYEPTMRDRLSSWLMGDKRASPYKARFVEGLLGSRGMGTTGIGVSDFTPLGVPMQIQESLRSGDTQGAALAIMPGGGAINRGGQKVAKEAAKEVQQGIRAFHGSPHDFDRFDMSKIGTGEGAQAFGHGLYFAESPQVAESYKGAGVRQQWSFLDPPGVKGRMYEVNIKADPGDFLDWDKPLSEQSEKVKLALDKLWGGFLDQTAPAMRYAPTSPEMAKKSGLAGIKYLDQGSRTAGEGSRNYVVFDDRIIDIVKKYGVAAVATALGMSEADLQARMEKQRQ